MPISKTDLESLTLDDLAKLFGVTLQTLRDWKKRPKNPFPVGRKKPAGKGDFYDWYTCLEWFQSFIAEKASKGYAKSTDDIDVNLEKALKLRAERELAELDLAIARKDLVPAKETLDGFQDRVLKCRSKLLVLPPKVSIRITSDMQQKQIEALLDKEVREALEELSKEEAEDED